MAQMHDACVAKFNRDASYRRDFAAAFGPGPATLRKAEMAMASFERTLIMVSAL